MKYAALGRSGLKVSRLCLGTMNFGVSTDEKEAFRIMDAALDAGINFGKIGYLGSSNFAREPRGTRATSSMRSSLMSSRRSAMSLARAKPMLP
ncbi:hypothetical protein GCM10010913_39400 [Paenibacillus aceti]|uniref:NADP-dependent oxidoreductase domain-containing protein n=1 Tax=Paenibacillus aceti TaxID=1820010 RepID=A0ABQ1W5K3_9BACL|nr:hypothetical protein GCM10010913_39400 [Paenibacillus aceti]